MLVIIFAAIGWISSYKDVVETTNTNELKETQVIVPIMGEREVSSKNVIVNDRFVGTIEKDATIVAVSSNRQAYAVKSGVILADDMVVKVSNEDISIVRLDNLRSSQ